MNIDSQLRNLFASYPSRAPQADAQRSAPSATRAQQGPQINYASHHAKSPASNAAGIDQAIKSEVNSLISLLNRLMKMLTGLVEQNTQPDTKASNAANPGSSPNANHQGNSANRAHGAGRSNTQQGGQASYSGQAGDVPIKRGPYSEQDLVSGFWQERGTENCVTVAAIKAAMQKEGGPADVYESVKENGNGFDVKMKDSDKIYHVSIAELEEAARKSGFKGDNKQMLKDANFMYAVSAKRAQMENNDGIASRSFSHALATLNSWEHTAEGLQRLGLKNRIRRATPQELANGAAGVMAKNDHVFTVLNGRIEDYGRLGRAPGSRAEAYKLV